MRNETMYTAAYMDGYNDGYYNREYRGLAHGALEADYELGFGDGRMCAETDGE